MALTVTVGTNSYISLVDAETYIADYCLYSNTWNAASDTEKNKALVLACKKIDRQVLRGVKSENSQTIQFPRAIFAAYDRYPYVDTEVELFWDNHWVVESVVSQSVKDAQCEEAVAILEQGNTSAIRENLQAQGVRRLQLGNAIEEYSLGSVHSTKLLSQEARQLLAFYIARSVPIV